MGVQSEQTTKFVLASRQVFLVTVTAVVFPAGFLAGWWTARKIDSRFVSLGVQGTKGM